MPAVLAVSSVLSPNTKEKEWMSSIGTQCSSLFLTSIRRTSTETFPYFCTSCSRKKPHGPLLASGSTAPSLAFLHPQNLPKPFTESCHTQVWTLLPRSLPRVSRGPRLTLSKNVEQITKIYFSYWLLIIFKSLKNGSVAHLLLCSWHLVHYLLHER